MVSATTDRLLFRNTMQITPGHLDEFTRAIHDAVAFAEEHAPQRLVDVFIDRDAMQATSFQLYDDSESVLKHWTLSDPYIAEVMRHCTVARFEVFGTPSAAVREGLGATSGVQASFTPRLVGYG
jgi:hypothetical protein